MKNLSATYNRIQEQIVQNREARLKKNAEILT
jgi:hypothetical protein